MSKSFIFILLLFCSVTNAQWFQSSGEAFIIDNDLDSAREKALKQAVKNALLFSGGTISSLQQVNNGILVENQLLLNSEGEIKALTMIDETEENNKISVTIKVDIEVPKDNCQGSNYPKSISITRFKLNNPDQAVDGNLHAINQQVTKTLYNLLALSPQTLNLRQLVNIPVKLGEKYNDRNLVDTLRALSTQTDSQYIVYGEINDLSVEFKSKNSISYWLSNPPRHFYLTVYLYDALQGELLVTKQYRAEALWQYNKHATADLHSKLFWQRDYGQAIISLLDDVNVDLERHLQCKLPTAKVISVHNNSVQINLGALNGIKKGALLGLSYSSNYKDQFGIERSAESHYQDAMEVIEVHEKSAILRTIDKAPLGNIQINDLARIKQ
ncbi:flagellar assembly protein T N-terminal domain-containing protein [Psychromonas antarctica]|jgi:hypothetical protein|uniref:flagellar assembly protein T N-terminal domain-containing protein n=1 Tax=Psychromonas antarctica TaxID=67573 RepID=UPI001EE8DCAA|nr:flagellar assembly protein T N-terminal domain-containing protein [Psychromonas antarctica]MCG6199760.1 flagellar assembly protein FlgT [Psychromonas antarctica]